MNEGLYEHATQVWKKLGFTDFSAYADFMFNMAYGEWAAYGFVSHEEAAQYLRYLQELRRAGDDAVEIVRPPHLRTNDTQETLPLIQTTAA
ncbi:hypothetical protein [Nonomuraea bangladeshensis]|uniref:hypothetical protein n=1 Tax=Nonomuraea bangladeshensis TaxID=404385 RepID=UPI003C2BF17A